MNKLTMIARIGIKTNKKKALAYTVIDQNYQTAIITEKDIREGLASKKIVATNLGLNEAGDIIATNGAFDRYTFVESESGNIDGTIKTVILNRVEKNGEIIGYTAYTSAGKVENITVAQAVELVNNKAVANGKLNNGVVSAISGNFDIRTIDIKDAPAGIMKAEVLYFAAVPDAKVKYVGAIISCSSAVTMNKLTDTLAKSNAKIVEAVEAAAGKKVDSIKNTRVNLNSFYCIIDLSLFKKLISSGMSINKQNAKIVSVIKYSDGETFESVASIGRSLAIKKQSSSSEKLDKALEKFAAAIVEEFGEYIK